MAMLFDRRRPASMLLALAAAALLASCGGSGGGESADSAKMTPLAANFNIVPVRLLELENPNAVIRAQLGTAIPIFVVNVALIYFLAF